MKINKGDQMSTRAKVSESLNKKGGLAVCISKNQNRTGAYVFGDIPRKDGWSVYTIMFDGYLYVGSTSQIFARLGNHLNIKYRRLHGQLPLYRALEGVEAVTVMLSIFETKEEAKEAEKFLIDFYRAKSGLTVLNARRGATPTIAEKESFKISSRANRSQQQKKLVPRPLVAEKNGVVLNFDSVHDAARRLDLYPTNISACANGRLQTTGGWTFTDIKKRA